MSNIAKQGVRRVAVCGAALLLRIASRPCSPGPGPALFIAPHADDETLGCGGIIAAGAAAKRRQRVVFLTDSSASHPRHPRVAPSELAAMRRDEAIRALAELGVGAADARFLGAADGTLDRLAPERSDALIGELSALIASFGPAEVYVTYRGDGSTEHLAAHRLVRAALAASGGGILMEYPVWAWWDPRRFGPRLRSRRGNLRFRVGDFHGAKMRALARHCSQVSPLPPETDPALPPILARSCCGPYEFFFRSRVSAGAGLHDQTPWQ